MNKPNIRTSNKDEHKEVIAEMKAIDGFDNELFDNPMVGIFCSIMLKMNYSMLKRLMFLI